MRANALIVCRQCLLFLCLSALPIIQASEPVGSVSEFKPHNSSAEFSVRVLLLLTLEGQFDPPTGRIVRHFQDHTFRVFATLDANSIRMKSEKNTAWVKSAEFFDVQNHPKITFASQPIAQHILEQGGEINGQLSVRGIQRNITLQVQPPQCANSVSDCRLRVIGDIARSEFGMQSKRGILSDKVKLELTIGSPLSL